MQRHYYLSNDLGDLKVVEQQLELAGVTAPQIHVLSHDDSGVALHKLPQVEDVLRKDVVHGTELGAIVGVLGAGLVLFLAWWSGLTATYTWVPAVFLAIIVLGFCTWEGGLIGIQEPHTDFRRFQHELAQGQHVLFVDVDTAQEATLQNIVADHPGLRDAGKGASTPRWVVDLQNKWATFLRLAP